MFSFIEVCVMVFAFMLCLFPFLYSNFQLRVSNTYWFAVSFEGQHYCSDFLPSKQFSNHASCKAFTDFVSEEILKRLTVSALRVWGRVGDDSPPYLVLPWMTDLPFSLDRLVMSRGMFSEGHM